MTKLPSMFIALPVIICITTGCMSTNLLRGKIRDMQSPVHEFASGTKTQGNYLGTTHVGSLDYHKYTFPDALHGHPTRDLVMLIPLDRFRGDLGTNPRAKAYESNQAHYSGQEAFLYRDPQSFDSPYPGQNQALRWPRGTCPDGNKDIGVVVIWLDHAGADTIIVAQAAPGVAKTNESFNSYFVDSDLRYVARKRVPMYLLHLGYAITIPIDVLTFPFQAVVWYGFKYGT